MGAVSTDRILGANTGLAVKAPVLAVATSNITLSGLNPVGSYTPNDGDRILVIGQSDATTNGIYQAHVAGWTRTADFSNNSDVVSGTLIVIPIAGSNGVFYQLTSPNPVSIGSSALNFQLLSNPSATFIVTASEIGAGVVPATLVYPDIRRYNAKFDGATDDTTAVNQAILVAQQTINGAVGNVVTLPLGTSILSSEVTLPNDVRFLGTNKNGSIFKAAGGWNSGTSPYMFHAVNGTSSMFDGKLENLTIDCSDIAGLGAVLSDAWQENSGPRSCLIYRFRTYAIHYQNGYGGAAYNVVQDTEIFGSTSGATAGIRVEQISSVGSFQLIVERATIAGSVAILPRGIDIVNDSSRLSNVHVENCTSGIYLDGIGDHLIIGASGDVNTTNVVELAATFAGSLEMIGCRRSGATNLLKDNRVGGLGTVTGVDIGHITIGRGSGSAISAITNAASAVVTFSSAAASNPFSVGSLITFSGVQGMTQINGLQGTVSAIGGSSGAWTATVNINSSGFGAYTSGGRGLLPADRAVQAPNTAAAWCTFDGTKTGTNAPTAGFNVKSVTRNSAGNYTVNFQNPLLVGASQAISVISSGTADVVQNLGPTASNAQFVVNALAVSAGVLVTTPTDRTPMTFICFGQTI